MMCFTVFRAKQNFYEWMHGGFAKAGNWGIMCEGVSF